LSRSRIRRISSAQEFRLGFLFSGFSANSISQNSFAIARSSSVNFFTDKVFLLFFSVSVSVSERSSAFGCVRLRSSFSFWASRQAFARAAEPSSLAGWRFSHPETLSPSSTRPCITSRIFDIFASSRSSALERSSACNDCVRPRSVAFDAFTST
jgi:hypothetical protein